MTLTKAIVSLIITSLVLIGGFCYASSNVEQTSNPKVEILYGVNLGKESIALTVLSNGCTQTKHFKIHSTNTKSESVSIIVVRTQPDMCRHTQSLKKITLELPSKLQNKSLSFLNRFGIPKLSHLPL